MSRGGVLISGMRVSFLDITGQRLADALEQHKPASPGLHAEN